MDARGPRHHSPAAVAIVGAAGVLVAISIVVVAGQTRIFPPSSSSSICSARQNLLHFVSSSGVSLVVRGRWDNPRLLVYIMVYYLWSVVSGWTLGGRAAAPLLLWPLLVLPASSSVTFFIMVVAGFLAPSSSFFSTWPNLLHFICFPSPVVRLLHFLLLPPSSLLPPLASKFLTESA